MANTENEVERFKRIRDQQLKARDPQKGSAKFSVISQYDSENHANPSVFE